MDNNSQGAGKPATSPDGLGPALNKLAQYRTPIPAAFALAVVFFFFGFCNFKCNGAKVASVKGISLVTGTRLKTSMNSAFNTLDALGGDRRPSSKGEKIPPSLWAIIAFASAIAGFVIFYQGKKKESFWGVVLGAAGFISLFILRLVIKSAVEDRSGGMAPVDTSFLFGYWASLLAFILAGGISYLRLRAEKVPPEPAGSDRNAPTPIHIHVTTQHENNEHP